jgi:hypothetical protein
VSIGRRGSEVGSLEEHFTCGPLIGYRSANSLADFHCRAGGEAKISAEDANKPAAPHGAL